ncbi:MAG TPA: polysaccharide biosynthesis/export family protein, partial [Geminicoccaceae bacterium]|nr:polysaccharide biosynthesis/export family protein [Geminicoccaceae bacterium]
TPPPLPASAQAELGVSSYTVGPNDRIKVSVFNHPDLSGEFQLDGAGNFAMPLVGEVQANGLTTRQLEDKLRVMLVEGYLVEPRVGVEVLSYRPFYILGEVRSPGSYPYVNGMTVLNAVALAGGFTYRANQNNIVLQRGGTSAQAYSVSGTTPILPGDVIEVNERFF